MDKTLKVLGWIFGGLGGLFLVLTAIYEGGFSITFVGTMIVIQLAIITYALGWLAKRLSPPSA